ncbi:hypothetical protein EAI_02286 [Harpegnathos saltator]|uniref:Uncharacterized protein n=1 Tax=Harpegnathos saltator TaxID=610380 RepID=E2BZI0_HARSA|nr:hypothetical protein EAI_02286 [Harpegnathos saltator]
MTASRRSLSDHTRQDRSQNNRIRKLLLSEYREFSDTVLVESPFAETTRTGRGLRQVALGLTPTNLIVAADVLRNDPGFFCPPGIDASIESFELVSVYPLEYVQLSVFGRRRRRTLKARYTLVKPQRNNETVHLQHQKIAPRDFSSISPIFFFIYKSKE